MGKTMNFTEMRARARQVLEDEDAASYRWSDDEVDGAIERAVREFSLRYPVQQRSDVPTSEDSNEIDISSLEKLVKVYSVEFPIGQRPPRYQEFAVWQSTIHMEDSGNGDDARIRWGRLHTLDAEFSTIPERLKDLIVLGATGYLATIAGRHDAVNLLDWGRARLAGYEHELRAIALEERGLRWSEPGKAHLKSKMR